ncbi:cationic amino acid transporter 2-like [Diadema antillarum]|uniref:cationic amino acid transporter 2-like n=1 Tax=Diadema antillarum TaxID=105358 RepID=UPI003A8AFEBE
MTTFRRLAGVLLRKKQINTDPTSANASQLRRCLSAWDLILLGIGNTLGAGIYVVTGQVAKWQSGPAIVVSFSIAAIAAILAGTCFAELGARVPKAGSAYVYTYVTMGEFIGFFVGWNVLIENILGAASVARATTAYIDSLIGNQMDAFLSSNFAMNTSWLASYPDFLGFAFCIVSSVLMGIGVKTSSVFNNVFTGLNLFVILYIVICGFFKVVPSNWSIPVSDLPHVPCDDVPHRASMWANGSSSSVVTGGPRMCSEFGAGGFFPYGVGGVFSGAAVCFYAFIGFEVVATAGEEVRNPQRTLPIGILVSLSLTFLAYVGVSSVMTLMCPYFLLDEEAPLPVAFDAVGWTVARYIIGVGGICGLITSLYGCMFALPRFLYSMAEDGIIFRFLGTVHSRFRTPFNACLVSGVIAGIITLVIDLQSLVSVVVMGAMVPFLTVAACVIMLRYEPDMSAPVSSHTFLFPEIDGYRSGFGDARRSAVSKFLSQAFWPIYDEPTPLSFRVVIVCVILLICSCFGMDAMIIFGGEDLIDRRPWAIGAASGIGAFILLLMFIIIKQPQSTIPLAFKVPLVPLLPTISIFIDSYLLMKMDAMTWVRYVVLTLIGIFIYFAYSVWHSKERYPKKRYRYPSTRSEAQQGGRCRRTSSVMLCSESGCTHDLPHNLLEISKQGNVQDNDNEPPEVTKLISESSLFYCNMQQTVLLPMTTDQEGHQHVIMREYNCHQSNSNGS